MNSVAHSGGGAPRVGVIGAGPCGLTALKNLVAAGVREVVCFEANDAVGGNWVYRDAPDQVSVYSTTHIISSKSLSSFEDFPMPADYPDFPSHRQMRAYFESYAQKFGLLRFIRFGTRVDSVRRGADGRWQVETSSDGKREQSSFDYLLLANGHHRVPLVPEYPGTFSGKTLHSAEYKDAEPFRGQRVLVVGGGNSACDIAVETSRVSAKTCLSMRRGYYILPKILFGRPIDVMYERIQFVPKFLRQLVSGLLLRLAIGPWEKYGLQDPDCGPFEMHPTLNSEILYFIRHGLVHPRVGIERLDGKRVHFKNGKAEEFDAIIWATGFRMSFPFLDQTVVDWDTADPAPLYLKMMHPKFDNLFFIGLFQPIGCIWRLADHQARIAALQITGALARPPDLAARLARELRTPHWRFERRPRHAVEVDFHDFHRELVAELARADPAQAA